MKIPADHAEIHITVDRKTGMTSAEMQGPSDLLLDGLTSALATSRRLFPGLDKGKYFAIACTQFSRILSNSEHDEVNVNHTMIPWKRKL